MMLQISIRTEIMRNPAIEPTELLRIVNNSISYNIQAMKEQKFVTIVALSFKEDGNVIFSGRHEDLLIFRSAEEKIENFVLKGKCISPYELGTSGENYELYLNTGDILMLYTDGIIEATDENDEMYSIQKLQSFLKRKGHLSPEEIKDGVINEIKDYSKMDDVTILIIRKC